jgi:hypothetical protein
MSRFHNGHTIAHWIKRAGKLNSQLPRNHQCRREDFDFSPYKLEENFLQNIASEFPVATMDECKQRAILSMHGSRRRMYLSPCKNLDIFIVPVARNKPPKIMNFSPFQDFP